MGSSGCTRGGTVEAQSSTSSHRRVWAVLVALAGVRSASAASSKATDAESAEARASLDGGGAIKFGSRRLGVAAAILGVPSELPAPWWVGSGQDGASVATVAAAAPISSSESVLMLKQMRWQRRLTSLPTYTRTPG